MQHSDFLVLLQPHNLTSNYQLNESKKKLCCVLNLFCKALDKKLPQDALLIINQTLEMLNPQEITVTKEDFSTNTSLQPWEVDDYDKFFGLKHIEAKEPAECLVMSVLKAYQTLLELHICISDESLQENIETQKIAFKSCLRLLTRAFNLFLEKSYD